jgi:hypothetical protein
MRSPTPARCQEIDQALFQHAGANARPSTWSPRAPLRGPPTIIPPDAAAGLASSRPDGPPPLIGRPGAHRRTVSHRPGPPWRIGRKPAPAPENAAAEPRWLFGSASAAQSIARYPSARAGDRPGGRPGRRASRQAASTRACASASAQVPGQHEAGGLGQHQPRAWRPDWPHPRGSTTSVRARVRPWSRAASGGRGEAGQAQPFGLPGGAVPLVRRDGGPGHRPELDRSTPGQGDQRLGADRVGLVRQGRRAAARGLAHFRDLALRQQQHVGAELAERARHLRQPGGQLEQKPSRWLCRAWASREPSSRASSPDGPVPARRAV